MSQSHCKSVIIYTYFQSEVGDYNLYFFMNQEVSYKENIDYLFVINGFHSPSHIVFPSLPNVTVLRRENKGYDFGGHAHALQHLQTHSQSYDYYFFINSGVIGPILPYYMKQLPSFHWSQLFIQKITSTVKLVGTTIVCLPHSDAGGYGPKVEGFFFMTDQQGIELLLQKQTIFCNHDTKHSAIVNGEYGLSTCMFEHGYSIDCMIPMYQHLDWKDSTHYTLNQNKHPSRKNSFYGMSLNPYDLIFHKWFWRGESSVNEDLIHHHVNQLQLFEKK